MSVVHATLEPGAAWTHAAQHVECGHSLGCLRLQPELHGLPGAGMSGGAHIASAGPEGHCGAAVDPGRETADAAAFDPQVVPAEHTALLYVRRGTALVPADGGASTRVQAGSTGRRKRRHL